MDEPNTTALTTSAPAAPAVVPPLEETRSAPRITFEQLMSLPDNEYRTRWMNSLIEADTARQNYAQDMALARQFATSGQFDDLKGQTPAQGIATAMVKIQFGRTWKLEPADAMRSIYFTNGRPSIENEIVAARLQAAGIEWSTEFEEESYEHKGRPASRVIGCTLYLMRMNPSTGRLELWLDRQGNQRKVTFSQADADTAQIWEKGKSIPLSDKWNFRSWSRDMYYWRAVSRVKKYHAPNVLRGALSQAEALELPPPEPAPVPKVEIVGMPEVQAEPAPAGRESRAARRVMEQGSFLSDADEGPGE
jgi:hypothetical protein